MKPSSQFKEAYVSGKSIPQISAETGVARSTIRFSLKRDGALRSRSEAIQIASVDGRLGGGLRGKTRVFSDEWKENISKAKTRHGERFSVGFSKKPSGYLEYTRGENKFRSIHVVAMEEMIGRRLLPNECVHHIDGDKANNSKENLQLMTRSEHASHHATENLPNRKRNSHGQFE